MLIEGVSAVVAGGGSGLGKATAMALAARGAKVVILDLNKDAGDAAADAIGAIAISCDVASDTSVSSAFQAVKEKHGVPRICVNCAGIAAARRIVGRDGPMPLEEFGRVIHVNLIGTFNVMRIAAAAMGQTAPLNDGERGIIINTASVAAFDGQVGQAAYAAAKGGVVSLTLPAARELAQSGIRVLTIAPGIFDTPLLHLLPQDVQDGLAAAIPFPHRLGKSDEFAALAIHMIENVMLNGEVVRLDGAIRLAPK
jgi:NAD(P)-dependent dehydrogenase (short-subunit alcohol dehydrogenase family)